MPKMVRMRGTSKMPVKVRKSMSYRTRMLVAPGQVFEIAESDARALRVTGWAEDVQPPKAPEPVASVNADEYDGMTVAELRAEAEARDLELPEGYVRRDVLLQTLRGTVA